MATTTDIPVIIQPDAEARIKQLGIRREVEQMLEHTKQTISGLELIEIEAWDDEGEPGQPHLRIVAWRPGKLTCVEDLQQEKDWGRWFVSAFSPDVFRWFSFFIFYRDDA